MQEALPYENMIRRKSGKVARALAPRITSEQMSEEVDFSEELCRVALPYGVAAYYWQDEGDSYRAADYRQRFIIALGEAVGGGYVHDIEDADPYGAAMDN